MATTTNFGWDTPDDTDLVKDGALAIRTLGSSIDTSFVDLKGGTTGQVLSKASNTDLDYTWVTTDDANAIQNAIVDAKGDLIAASAADTPARLAVGNNGETLVADSAATVGLRYQPAYNGNGIINGAFDIWQRGTSFTAANAYTADRWAKDSETVSTLSRQTTSDTTNLPTIQYCARVQRTAASSSTNNQGLIYNLETADSIRFAGQAVVVSFYARAGANYSAASSALNYNFYTGTGTDQRRSFPVGFTGEANIASSSKTLTTTWQRFSFTATVGATATELALMFLYAPVGTAGAADYFEITGVQLELGSVPTTFKRAGGGTIQGELAACQRYYYVLADAASQNFGTCAYYTATDVLGSVFFPVTMRTAPTFSAASGSFYEVVRNGAADALSGLQGNLISTRTANVFADSGNGASGTAGHAGQYRTTSASANIAFSAEL
jgi:hypothetical protein